MPGELYWNAPPAKDDDSDQDTFILMSSSDIDTPSSLENSREFNNLSFGTPSLMATKYGDGSPGKTGPSGQGEGSIDERNAEAQSHSTSQQGLIAPDVPSTSAGGGAGGGDRRGGDGRRPTGEHNLEDDSHEPRASGSSTSSGSIAVLAPVDPALDINTADLWPSVLSNDRNGHSDESGLSHATTAIVSDSETVELAMQSNPIVNPLLGATSASSTGTSVSKITKSSVNLDISSATLSTLSSGVSSSSSYEDKKSTSDTSLSRMDTSMDISGDHNVEGLLANDGKLGEFHTSHIDIFNNSTERFTSTPAEEIGMMDFHHQAEILESSDENEMVIPSTQEEMEKISFVIPNAPLPVSGSLKRPSEDAADDSGSSRKISRPSLRLQPLNTVKDKPASSKRLSEKAIAMDKIGQFIERGLKTSESENIDADEQQRNEGNHVTDDVQLNPSAEIELASTAISRKLLFESSQSSSSGGESSFKPVVVEDSCKSLDENAASVVQETCGALISKVFEELFTLVEESQSDLLLASDEQIKLPEKPSEEREIVESSQETESQSIIESSQPVVTKLFTNKTTAIEKDNFKLRYSPTLQDMESQYFPFGEEDKPSRCEVEPKLCDFSADSIAVSKTTDKSSCEVPESEVSDGETLIHPAQPTDNEDTTVKDTKETELIIISSSLDGSLASSTSEAQTNVNDVDAVLPSAAAIESKTEPSENKRNLEQSDEEKEHIDKIGLHKRRKLIQTEETLSLPSTSVTEAESTNLFQSKEDDIKMDENQPSPRIKQLPSSTRDQEVQTIESVDSKTLSGKNQKDAILKRRTVLVKRIIIEEYIRRGRVYKKNTEEVDEDPLITECYVDNENMKAFVSPHPVEKDSTVSPSKSADSSLFISSTERSGTSSGWLGDLSASASKSSSSSSATKLPSKGLTPSRLAIGDSASSGSSLGMKTLRSVRRRQFSEFKKTLHLSPDKSVPDQVASSTPKSSLESSSKSSKSDAKAHKAAEAKRTPPPPERGSIGKRKKSKRKTKTKAVVPRNTVTEEKSPSPKKKGKASETDKSDSPREQLILKINKKSSSIVSPKFDDSRTLKPGVRVMAKYRDGYYYPGRAVDQERHDRWKILYDDGDTRSIRTENILVVDLLPVGQSIYVQSQDGFYDSAIIVGYVEVNGEIQYAIEMDEGTKRQVKQTEVILTTDQAACMEKLPLGTMHGYTSICLDNIIEGKRRSRDMMLEGSPKTSRRDRNAVSGSPSTFSANEESDHSSSHFKSSK